MVVTGQPGMGMFSAPGIGSLFGFANPTPNRVRTPRLRHRRLVPRDPRPLSLGIAGTTAAPLPRQKPRYAMGVGRPEVLAEYVARGVDMMDCALPSRNARNGCRFGG